MMEVRQALERQAVRLACARARPRDLEKMEAALGRIEATIDEPIAGGMAETSVAPRKAEPRGRPVRSRSAPYFTSSPASARSIS